MFIHFDEARHAAEEIVAGWVSNTSSLDRALLVGDLFGKLRLLLWSVGDIDTSNVEADLAAKCGVWWSGQVIIVNSLDEPARTVYLSAWDTATRLTDRFGVADRHRTRNGWFSDVADSLWPTALGPPVVVFYSFKGGLGRTMTLAAFAIQRARAGERVCLIDFDLDSPGAGLLLNHGAGVTARWGVVDFLIEHSIGTVPLDDYSHRCDRVAGAGQIIVFPSGQLNEDYINKLARVDLEEARDIANSGVANLLRQIREVMAPQWILLDTRTGASDSAGYLLSGIAHLHVLLGSNHEQSWIGLGIILDRLGKKRIIAGRSQSDIVLVQAMVPSGEAGRIAKQQFRARAEHEFVTHYYAATDDGDSSELWDVNDIDSGDAPHASIAIDYEPKLAAFNDIADIADDLCAGQYAIVAERIAGRFMRDES